jgi:hypothetical protein
MDLINIDVQLSFGAISGFITADPSMGLNDRFEIETG